MRKKWLVKERRHEDLLAQLLFTRGVEKESEIERFLNPDYERELGDPFLFSGMENAVGRIWQAISKDERVVIFADYDADGVPGAVILTEFFRKIGFSNFQVCIPDRHREPYGLSEKAVRKLSERGNKLIITIDCGINDVAEVVLANELGLEVIITDHHLPQEKIPPALAIVDARQERDKYPFKMLCGAGVVFKLVQALIARIPEASQVPPGWEKWLLDLVAIATVSDMVPLVGENRALAHFGLKVLRQTRRPGLLALFNSARLKPAQLGEDDIGFMIGPRLNAAGWLGELSEAYHLLTTEDMTEAEELIAQIEERNNERKEVIEKIVKQVDGALAEHELPPIIVLGDPNWPAAVVGRAAGRIVERYNRPTCLWGRGDAGLVKGSCRSDGSVNLVDLLVAAGGEEFFKDVGGHAMASGFGLLFEKADELSERIPKAFSQMEKKPVVQELEIDAILPLEEATSRIQNEIVRLAPFGIGNAKPLFLIPDVLISGARTFGNGGIHLELRLQDKIGRVMPAVGFFSCVSSPAGEPFDATDGHNFHNTVLEPGRRVDLAANLEQNYFRGRAELRLRIVDLRKSE